MYISTLVFDKKGIKKQIKRFFTLKVLGSFESMRAEMELRYQAKQVFITCQDKTKIHGFFIPCLQAR